MIDVVAVDVLGEKPNQYLFYLLLCAVACIKLLHPFLGLWMSVCLCLLAIIFLNFFDPLLIAIVKLCLLS